MRDTGRVWRAAAAVGVALGTGAVLIAPPAVAAPVNYDILLTASNSAGLDVAYTVPPNVCSIAWKVFGGQGSANTGVMTSGAITAPGGKGGRVEVVTAVTPGDQFQLEVGEAGTEAAQAAPTVAAARSGSAPSGGSAIGYGNSGGGASVVRAMPSGTAVIIAGGGGAAGTLAAGGDAGAVGADGTPYTYMGSTATGGLGASAGAAGAGGGYTGTGVNGNGGAGPVGGQGLGGSGGGGGGRYGGGSGGSLGTATGVGGGGGSNLAPTGATINGTFTGTGGGKILGQYTACPVVPATPVPGTPPAPVAAAGNGSATLTWTHGSTSGAAVTRTIVTPYVNGVAQPSVVVDGAATSTVIPNLTNGTAYRFTVQTVSDGGGSPLSAQSNEVTPTAGPPEAPTAVTATARDGAAALTFTPGPDGGSPITGYQYCVDGTTWLPLVTTADGATRTATIPGLTNGRPVTVRVRATNQAGPGPAGTASPVTPTTGPPDAPTAVTAVARNASAAVTFTPGPDNGSPITGYEYSVGDGAWQPLPTTDGPAGTRTGTVTGLTNGVAASIRIRARNAAGPSPAAAAATVTPVAPPAAPSSVSAAAGTSSITVNWTVPPAGGAAVTGYTAIASPGPATCSTLVSDPAPTTCVLGAEAGVTYTITVVADSAAGASAPAGPSTAVVAAPPAAPPAPPATNLTLTTDKGRISTAEPGQQIVVIGTGFAPHSTAAITIYSTPIDLGTVITDADGNFSKPVTVPASLADGTHTVLAQGAAPDGSLRSMALAVTVDTTAALAVTGGNLAGLAAAGVTALILGAGMLHAGRTARRYPRVLPFGVAHS